MPYLNTAQQWLTQSTLLLKARPSTTRITTKYTITPQTTSTKPPKTPSKPETTTPGPPAPIPATLTLKTYDPASGVTLKYSTNKAAEVSRLIQILGRLARPMAGLPEIKEEPLNVKIEEGLGEGSGGPGTPAGEVVPGVVGGGKVGGAAGGGGQQAGKKGKKKGKK